ncbi:hypothetical protein NQZ68_000200 [Dissostichus eleginoides]|nr:hypothetical protein NQZ68_000200 [Dissostichus eleginoides]
MALHLLSVCAEAQCGDHGLQGQDAPLIRVEGSSGQSPPLQPLRLSPPEAIKPRLGRKKGAMLEKTFHGKQTACLHGLLIARV